MMLLSGFTLSFLLPRQGPRHVKAPKLNPEAGHAVRHLPPADEEDKPVGRACAERVEVPASCYFYRYF